MLDKEGTRKEKISTTRGQSKKKKMVHSNDFQVDRFFSELKDVTHAKLL